MHLLKFVLKTKYIYIYIAFYEFATKYFSLKLVDNLPHYSVTELVDLKTQNTIILPSFSTTEKNLKYSYPEVSNSIKLTKKLY